MVKNIWNYCIIIFLACNHHIIRVIVCATPRYIVFLSSGQSEGK